jgi:hypothetical protein
MTTTHHCLTCTCSDPGPRREPTLIESFTSMRGSEHILIGHRLLPTNDRRQPVFNFGLVCVELMRIRVQYGRPPALGYWLSTGPLRWRLTFRDHCPAPFNHWSVDARISYPVINTLSLASVGDLPGFVDTGEPTDDAEPACLEAYA